MDFRICWNVPPTPLAFSLDVVQELFTSAVAFGFSSHDIELWMMWMIWIRMLSVEAREVPV